MSDPIFSHSFTISLTETQDVSGVSPASLMPCCEICHEMLHSISRTCKLSNSIIEFGATALYKKPPGINMHVE